MQQYRVLFADNDADFLETRTEYLEAADYAVVKANDLQTARTCLAQTYLHVAVLDIRLVDDDDERDTSGLSLAKDPAFSLIPKIVLTGFPSYQAVRDVLGPAVEGMPAAVNFLAKAEGPEALIQAIGQAVEQYIGINRGLRIHWQETFSFAHLLKFIEPQATGDLLVDRLSELEDLFRKLFFTCAQITIGSLLTHAEGVVSLLTFAYETAGRERQYVVTCGQRARIRDESNHFDTFAPTGYAAPSTVKTHMVETLHFAALAYQLAGGDLEEITPLRTFYRTRTTQDVQAAVEHLYTNTLARWYETGRFQPEAKNLKAAYQSWLKFHDDDLTRAELSERVAAIAHQAVSTGLLTLDYQAGNLVFSGVNLPAIICTDPIRQLDRLLFDYPTLYGIIHSHINGDTVLVNPHAQTWLVDFAAAGRGPLLCDFVSLEVAIKFDLADSDLMGRYAVEQRLLKMNQLDDPLDTSDFPQEARKTLTIIRQIRQYAAKMVGASLKPYMSGLFFCSLKRVLEFNPEVRHTKRELIPAAHALFACALLTEQLYDPAALSVALPAKAYQSLWLDEVNKTTWVEGQVIKLTPQEYDILFYLYKRAGQLCSRQEIVENVLGGAYQEEVERGRLNSAMSRLCQKVEPDPEKYRYIETVRGQGYRLNL